jgi:hypothetical protein
MICDPLDLEVGAVADDQNLGIVAVCALDGEDVTVDKLVGRIVIAIEGSGAIVGGL